MTLYLRNFFVLICLSLIFSCETVVDLDIEEDPQLVIHSLFTPGELNDESNPFIVGVYETLPIISKNELEFLSTAVVTITPTDQEEEILSIWNPGLPSYRTIVSGPVEGRSYELHVSNEDHESVIARSYVPLGVDVENLTFKNIESYPHEFYPNETEYNFNVQFEIEDDELENNFYHLIFWRVVENNLPGDAPDETRITVSFDEDKTKQDPSVQIVNYNRAFFGAHINDASFNGQRKKFDFEMVFSKSETAWPENIRIQAELRTVSEDYYRYQTEGARYTNKGNNTFFDDKNTISNNIENGYGLFAGYAIRTNRQDLKEE